MTTLFTQITAILARQPDRPFLMDGAESFTRAQALAAIARRQHQLRAAGVAHGDKVLVPGGRGLTFWLDMLAVWGLGAVFVPVGIGSPPEHVHAMINITEPKACTGKAAHLGELPAHIAVAEDLAVSGETPLFVSGETPLFVSGETPLFVSGETPLIDVSAPGDPAAICFTSGSTGLPKGVALTHQALLGNAASSQAALGPQADDRLFFAIPFNFISAVSHFLVMAMTGAEICATERRLLMAELYMAVAASGANCFGGSPLQLRWIADCAVSGSPLGLRWMMSSGDHLSQRTIEALRKVIPDTRIFTVYGLTELGGRFCFLDPDLIDSHKGKVGKPIAGLSVHVLDEDGNPAPAGEIGEVHVRGAFKMDGYYKNPEATAAAMPEQGFRTGDLGVLDQDGFLSLAGRADDVFKCHGEKVSAVPIVDALMETGLFLDVAVIGHDDPHLGTVPKVLYVAVPDAVVDVPALGRRLRAALPHSHVPRLYSAVDAIPRTGSGKIKRVELRRLAQTVLP